MKKYSILYLLAFLVFVLPASASAHDAEKVTLNSNMTVVYNQLPEEAETISQVFPSGIFYGRFRTNIFYWDWDQENLSSGGSKMDHRAMGIGGSLIYKSAPYKGLSSTIGLYTSQNPSFFREDKADVGYVKSGKDTFSRNEIKNGGGFDGNFGMTVPGQIFLQYDIEKAYFILGRQLFESVFTASNDTKMIPNTFDGLSANITPFSHTTFQFAWFTAQKLRDHIHSHDVIAYDSWNENDDSAVNKSLTKDLVGTDNELIFFSVNTKMIENLNTSFSYLMIPDILTNTVFEGHYKVSAGKWSVTPGIRFLFQNDQLDTNALVANLVGNTTGYRDPDSLDGKLYAVRLDLKKGPLSLRLGYSKVDDDADIIAPWRGFPTGGFTRAMGQYNWQADTETFMFSVDYDFDKAGLIPGVHFTARYAIQNFDDIKPGVQPDSRVLNIDILKKLSDNLEMKFRVDIAGGDKNTYDINGALKTDISYDEYRLECNYFF